MPAPTPAFAENLRDARLAKGWSQRELSQRSGLPQAHISRIEAGSVDPKLSTFQELSRLLDLELVLVPRQALTAVEVVLRDIETDMAARPVRALANILARLAKRLEGAGGHEPRAERLADRVAGLSRDLAHFEPAIAQSPDTLSEMRRLGAEIESAADPVNLDRLADAVSRLAALRNALAHPRPDAQRPAYTLDDDED